MDEGIRGL